MSKNRGMPFSLQSFEIDWFRQPITPMNEFHLSVFPDKAIRNGAIHSSKFAALRIVKDRIPSRHSMIRNSAVHHQRPEPATFDDDAVRTDAAFFCLKSNKVVGLGGEKPYTPRSIIVNLLLSCASLRVSSIQPHSHGTGKLQ